MSTFDAAVHRLNKRFIRACRESAIVFVILGPLTTPVFSANHAELVEEVRAAETAFAKTLADRDPAAFATYLADETIFFGRGGPIVGRQAVIDAWAPFFEGEAAPFSWKPELVQVLASGTLGFSSGPVWSPEGKHFNSFNSIWRREPDGRWLIVFDKGCPVCDPAPAPPASPSSELPKEK